MMTARRNLLVLVSPLLLLMPSALGAADRVATDNLSQTPQKYLSIQGISQQDHRVTALNIGTKPVSGYAVQNLANGNEWNGWVQSTWLIDPPLQTGETESHAVWPEITKVDQIRIAAVIFADGTHVGSR
jgi:hypothetical protein